MIEQKISELRSQALPFAVATVIQIEGSASARAGSKAIFDLQGKNIQGWVGGGCAERFVGEQALAALKEQKTRIITADMDDEIFGLGVVCGGKMQIFIEPFLPPEEVVLPRFERFQNEAEILASAYGWKIHWGPESQNLDSIEDLFLRLSDAIALKRNRTGRSLREIKDLPVTFASPAASFWPGLTKEVSIVGRSRITEALARHFVLLGYNVHAFGPLLKSEDYPKTVACHCLASSYEDARFFKNGVAIIASHTSQDPTLVQNALEVGAGYIAMVGSRVRALEVLNHLQYGPGKNIEAPLFVPAGLDLDARHPEEIALSIVAEVIRQSGNRV